MVYKLISGIYDSDIACQLVKPTNLDTRGYLNDTINMICVIIILEIVSYSFRMVCLTTLLMLTQLVYLRIIFLNKPMTVFQVVAVEKDA